jgi:hypothetical protein
MLTATHFPQPALHRVEEVMKLAMDCRLPDGTDVVVEVTDFGAAHPRIHGNGWCGTT